MPDWAAWTIDENVDALDASEPVTRIMSVPAVAARIASEVAVTPRAEAVPERESVIVTPLKPSWVRSRSTLIAFDQPAPFALS